MFQKTVKLFKVKNNINTTKNYRNESSLFWVKTIILTILTTFSGLFIFACLVKIDEVVSVKGEIQMKGAERPIKSPINGEIKDIYVEEGDRVKSGDTLIQFDTQIYKDELSKLKKEDILLNERYQLAKELKDKFLYALNEGLISKDKYYSIRNEEISILNQINENNSLQDKNNFLINQGTITSPTNGKVFNIIPYSIGYIAKFSETLLYIVPDKNLEVKILIPNSQIGFINKSMKVEIRVDAFPFTEFGSLIGEILTIGAESITPQNTNLSSYFPAYLKLDQEFILKDNISYELKPGQSVTANIVLRKKRLITTISDIFERTFDSLRKI